MNVINKINYIINENKKNLQLLRNDISSMCNQMNKRFDKLEINNLNNQELKFSDGKYIGQVVNGLAEGKGKLGMVIMVIDMKGNGEIVKKKVKEFIIIKVVIDMKVIGERVRKKEKEFIIIIMVIEKWVIIIIIKEQESMLLLQEMELLKQIIINKN